MEITSSSKTITSESQSGSENNTKSKEPYIYSKFVEEVIDQINLIRAKPSEYAAKLELLSNKIIGRKLKINKSTMKLKEGRSLFEEAINYLLSKDKMDPITLVDELSESAYDYLQLLIIQEGIDMSDLNNNEKYTLGRRLNNYGVYFGDFNELVDYGSIDAEFLALSFILGDNDPLRSDRNVILNPLIKYCGIASGILPSDKRCTVLNFVQYFFRPGEKVPNYIIKNYTYNNLEDINENSNRFEIFFDKKKKYAQKYMESSFSLLQEHPDGYLPNNKKVKKIKKITKKYFDHLTGKQVTEVKTIITYKDGEEVVDNYSL